jgi:integrase/recombinase XerD
MDTFIKSFLDYLQKERQYSTNTLSSYEGDLEQLNSYMKSKYPNSDKELIEKVVKPEVISGYLKSIGEKKYAISTLARKIASVKSFLKYMVETGVLKKDSIPNLDSPQVNKSITKPLSISEVKQLIAEPAKSTAIEGKRDRAMLELLYATGLTASELMALDIVDIDYENNSILCGKKTKKRRVIITDTHISRILKEYIDESRVKLLNNTNEVALFLNRRGERLTRQGFWQILQGYAEKVGLGKRVTPRSLRSSFVIHRLKNGADLQKIQELMGHAHISTTKAYQYLQ